MTYNTINVSKQIRKMLVKGILFFSASATAAIPPLVYPVVETRSESKPLNLDDIARLDLIFQNEDAPFDITQYVPVAELRVEMDESDFAHIILKNSLSRFIESQPDDSTLRSVKSVTQGLSSSDMKIGGDGNINHVVKFRLNPVEAETKVIYRGIASAEVSYDLDDDILRLEVSNKVGIATVVASHINSSSQRSDTLGVRWEF